MLQLSNLTKGINMLDLNELQMPGVEGEEELDLGLEEKGLEESPLADISDEELLGECEKRGLIDPEDSALETDEAIEGEESPLDLG